MKLRKLILDSLIIISLISLLLTFIGYSFLMIFGLSHSIFWLSMIWITNSCYKRKECSGYWLLGTLILYGFPAYFFYLFVYRKGLK